MPQANLQAILFDMPLAATVRAFGGPMLSDAELDTPVPTKLLTKDSVLVGSGLGSAAWKPDLSWSPA